ncbi:MAG: hypothetical protein LBP75_04530 [Planctomycetota bacterium]|nr:hypothetical protein [Planctomycetota bacterium]
MLLQSANVFFDNDNPARRKIIKPIFLWAGLLRAAPAGLISCRRCPAVTLTASPFRSPPVIHHHAPAGRFKEVIKTV